MSNKEAYKAQIIKFIYHDAFSSHFIPGDLSPLSS